MSKERPQAFVLSLPVAAWSLRGLFVPQAARPPQLTLRLERMRAVARTQDAPGQSVIAPVLRRFRPDLRSPPAFPPPLRPAPLTHNAIAPLNVPLTRHAGRVQCERLRASLRLHYGGGCGRGYSVTSLPQCRRGTFSASISVVHRLPQGRYAVCFLMPQAFVFVTSSGGVVARRCFFATP
ncbi:hypothetical protein RCF98_17740 (plasmid) [Thiothrix lacustris]|uniref:Secreted protein n=1 Tax=Thiothrix lacustris TaxID=525917 RepID=A0ABY9MV60_9GAMM|nr:hypothetical protein [Thiothrix lacustris]WML92528.1 hypothetical protein RCF98_17740 [Thiothrix lacustris]